MGADIGREIQTALLTQPGWTRGSGATVQALYDRCTPSDEDAFFDAIDALEAEGWLRVENGETADDEDVLFSTALSARQTASAGGTQAAGNSEAAERAVADELAAELAAGVLSVDAVPMQKSQSYDYEKESAAVAGVLKVVATLKRFGVDKADERQHAALTAFCQELEHVTTDSPAPPLRDDPRLSGDWRLVATTSTELVQRRGLTGLGGAPFTAPLAVFYRFGLSGTVIAKEVLDFFGRPILLNELRGKITFSPNGRVMQERYTAADLGGTRDSRSFTGATATIRCACVSADGSMRLGCVDGEGGKKSGGTAYFVYQKMGAGELEAWLEERQLPLFGGTVPTLSTEELRAAYPYLEKRK
jgi:hypothetical protein